MDKQALVACLQNLKNLQCTTTGGQEMQKQLISKIESLLESEEGHLLDMENEILYQKAMDFIKSWHKPSLEQTIQQIRKRESTHQGIRKNSFDKER